MIFARGLHERHLVDSVFKHYLCILNCPVASQMKHLHAAFTQLQSQERMAVACRRVFFSTQKNQVVLFAQFHNSCQVAAKFWRLHESLINDSIVLIERIVIGMTPKVIAQV